jgi:uncharacterized membrane protein YjjP (DUF1212 family)
VTTTTSTAPSADLLEFLRRCGVALCLAGEAASRIPEEMEAVADAYGEGDVELLVVPTGVFVRVVGHDGGVTVDFMNADGPPLRLDQVDSLYKLIEEVKAKPIPPADAIDKLDLILEAKPRFHGITRILGHAVLTVGLGLLLTGEGQTLIILGVLGLLVGLLRLIAERVQVLSLALPVAAAMLVTGLAYAYGPYLMIKPADLLIPPLVTFLPGAALTLGAQEMATRSMISGSSRIVSGVYMLLLLTFGIYAGSRIGTPPTTTQLAAEGWWTPVVELLNKVDAVAAGPWVPLLGVLIFGLGMYVNSSAPKRSLPWLLVMLFIAWGAQKAGAAVTGDGASAGLFGAFTGGLVVVPVATLVQRLQGPPAQVASLPAFWLLVPGALGLAEVSSLVSLDGGSSANNLITAFLTVVSVALGVLVGSSLTATARASSRLLTSRSVRKG